LGNTWLDNDIFITKQTGGWDYQIPGLSRCNGLPVTKCDVSGGAYHGTIYVNYTDQTNGNTDTDVWIVKSTDGGNNWAAPVKVNTDVSGRHQFMSWMDVDQSTGIVYCIFYDRRNYSNENTEVTIAWSADGGATWQNQIISDSPFDPTASIFFGDYTNIHVVNGKIAPIWTRMDNGVTSVWTALVDLPTLQEPVWIEQPDLLTQAMPNPFYQETMIEIEFPRNGIYSIELFDLHGRKMESLFSNQKFLKGYFSFPFQDSATESGVYLIQVYSEEMPWRNSLLLVTMK
jgi:hypothetical protein